MQLPSKLARTCAIRVLPEIHSKSCGTFSLVSLGPRAVARSVRSLESTLTSAFALSAVMRISSVGTVTVTRQESTRPLWEVAVMMAVP